MRAVVTFMVGILISGFGIFCLISTWALPMPPKDSPFGAITAATVPDPPAPPPTGPLAPPPPDVPRVLEGLRRIVAAEATYMSINGNYGRLDELFGMNLIDHSLCSATLPSTAYRGYVFRLAVLPVPAPGTYYLEATPVDNSGTYPAFYVDESGVLYKGLTPTHAHASPGQPPPGFAPVD